MITALYYITAASCKQYIALELRNIFLYCELSRITCDVGGQIVKFYFRSNHYAFIKDKSLLSFVFLYFDSKMTQKGTSSQRFSMDSFLAVVNVNRRRR